MDQIPISGRETSSEPVLRSRLLPRVSFQALMIVTAISAVVIAVVYAAGQGGTYSAAAAVALLFGAAMLCVSAAVFLLSWAVSFLPRIAGAALLGIGVVLAVCRIVGIPLAIPAFLTEGIWLLNFQIVGWFLVLVPIGKEPSNQSDSPFADEQLPPQIFAPREPTN